MSLDSKVRVALVITRAIDEASFGRVKVLREIRAALEAQFDVTVFRLRSLLETSHVRDFVGAGRTLALSALRGKPLPLQSVLYSGTREIESVLEALCSGDFQAVYVDSIRSQTFIRKLRERAPQLRLVVDFDDLMSRRMENLASGHIKLSLGFMQELVPYALRWSIEGPLSSLLVRYEAAALGRSEREVVDAVQAVVLVSSAERDLLRAKLGFAKRSLVHALPPPASECRSPQVASQYRFVFIGSDLLAQNRLSIDVLLDMWQRLRPSAALHIYGRQRRPNRDVRNVHWHGYVEHVSEAYEPGTILLLPAILAGGIKTKVIEAWSFGCPVLGNATAFEGLDVGRYPLVHAIAGWDAFVLEPSAHAQLWHTAATIGNEFARDVLSRSRFAEQWCRLMIPANATPQAG